VRVYKLAQQLNISSKKVLDAILELNISATSHQSSLSEDEVKRIIQYFEKNKKAGLLFNKSFLSVFEVIKSSLKKKSFASGLLIGISIFTVFGFSLSNNDEGQDTVLESQKINNITSTTIEIVSDENNSQDLSPPLFTDDVDSTTTTTVPTTTTTTVPTTTTTTVPTTTTTTVLTTTTTTVPTSVLTKYLVVGGNCSYSIIEVSESDEQFLSGMTLEEAETTRDEFNTWRCAENSTTTTTTTTVPISTNYSFEQNVIYEYHYLNAIDIDSSNNLYVTGTYNRAGTTIGSQTLPNYGAADIYVYKLNHVGDLEWLKTFGNSSDMGVYDIAVDQNGNSIVTGYFIGSLDFGTGVQTATGGGSTFVLKLDPNGDTVWVVTSTNGQRYDHGNGVDTDSFGNIYISGLMGSGSTNTTTSITFGSFTISSVNAGRPFYLKLNSTGEIQWVKAIEWGWAAGRVTVDSQDNKYLSGTCVGDIQSSAFSTVKGNATFFNVGGDDIATLSCGGQVNFPDVFVIKLDSSDNYVWHWNDFGYAQSGPQIISNSNGDVYASYYIQWEQPEICGTSVTKGIRDYFRVLVKLDSTGTCQWFYRPVETTDDRSYLLTLGLDSNNNIYFRYEVTESYFVWINIDVLNDQGVLQGPLFSDRVYPKDFVFDSDDNLYTFGTTEVKKQSLSDIE
jgi:hypothetical protein